MALEGIPDPETVEERLAPVLASRPLVKVVEGFAVGCGCRGIVARVEGVTVFDVELAGERLARVLSGLFDVPGDPVAMPGCGESVSSLGVVDVCRAHRGFYVRVPP